MNNLTIDYNDLVSIRKTGLKILTKELGPVGMTLFMRQYDGGYGNYTEERDELLKDLTINDVERELEVMQKSSKME